MTVIKIQKINEQSQLDSIDCGNNSINKMMRDSYYPTILQHAYCYVVSLEGKPVGAYMIDFMKIRLEECAEDVAAYESNYFSECVSVHLKYIAVDKAYQKRGIGTQALLYFIRQVNIICEEWPIRLITLEALKEKYGWYCNIGFKAFNIMDIDNDGETIKMYMDCIKCPDLVETFCESSM